MLDSEVGRSEKGEVMSDLNIYRQSAVEVVEQCKSCQKRAARSLEISKIVDLKLRIFFFGGPYAAIVYWAVKFIPNDEGRMVLRAVALLLFGIALLSATPSDPDKYDDPT